MADGETKKEAEATETTAATTTTAAITPENRAGLIERLRFFFSDANLRQDTFLRRHLWSDHKSIPVDALLRFKTIQPFTTDGAVLTQVAREDLADLLTVDGSNIGRVQPFKQTDMNANGPVSLYLKEIPLNEKEQYSITNDDVRAQFSQYPGLVLVKLCFKHVEKEDGKNDGSAKKKKSSRYGRFDRVANGTALVEFDSVEHLQAAAAETLTMKDGETVTPTRSITLVPDRPPIQVWLLSEFKRLKDQERSEEKKNNKRKSSGGEDAEKEENEGESSGGFTLDWKPGCVLQLAGLPEKCDREAILEAMQEAIGTSEKIDKKTVVVDFSRGQPKGYVQFRQESSPEAMAKAVCAKVQDGSVQVAGSKPEDVCILEGDEEKEYYKKYVEFKNNRNKRPKKN